MSFLPDEAPFPTYVTISMVGLGLASVFGAAKFWRHRSQVEGAEVVLERKDEEIASLRRSLRARQDDVNTKEEEIALLRQQADRMRKEMLALEKQLEIARNQNWTLSERAKALAKDSQRLVEEKQGVEVHLAQIIQLLDVRTAELKGAQTFLTKADILSGAEVIKLVVALNSDILQTAAFMAESFTFDKRKRPTPGDADISEELKEACTGASEILGPRMVQLLKTSEHHEDPILVQLAFQAGMAAYAHWIISSWYFEDPEDEHLLSEIYARVRESEEQPISGRWRALTRTHLQRMLAHEPDLSVYMVNAFVHVLITAGLTDSASALHSRIMKDFLERITSILRTAVRLNKAVGEGITSCDLEAFYVAPDVRFDIGTMEDAFADLAQVREDPEGVLCTTDLGLVRAERKAGKEADWHEAVLLKPKVVLQSGLPLPDAITP